MLVCCNYFLTLLQVLAEQQVRAAEEARVVAAAKAKAASEERKRAAEERACSYDETRRRAAEYAEVEAAAQRRAKKEREAAEAKAVWEAELAAQAAAEAAAAAAAAASQAANAVVEAEAEELRAEEEHARLQQTAAASSAAAAAAVDVDVTAGLPAATEPGAEVEPSHVDAMEDDTPLLAVQQEAAQEPESDALADSEPPVVAEVETVHEGGEIEGAAIIGLQEEESHQEAEPEPVEEPLMRPKSTEALSDAAVVLIKAAEAAQTSECEDTAQVPVRAGSSRLGSLSKQAATQALLMAADTAANIAVALATETDASKVDVARVVSDLVGHALAAAMVNEKASEGAVGMAADAVAASLVANASRPGSRGLPIPATGLPPLSPLPPPSLGGLPLAPPGCRPPSRPASRQVHSAGWMGLGSLEYAPEPRGSTLNAVDMQDLNATPPGTRPGTAGI
jgi:hypothetical protein